MKFANAMVIAGIVALSSTAALAATAVAIKDSPNGAEVTLSGTVEDFDSQHAFMLRDASGTVKIDLTSAKPMVLKDGEAVSVTGRVNHTVLGTDVVARNVSEDKGVGQQIGEAIDSVTGQDAAGSARVVTIQSLPNSGLVKLNGMVDSVASEKKFTLKDSTGHIDVSIKSAESASLKKGVEVTVIGNVDNGILGKKIVATEVDVRSGDSAPVATR
jgi:uncharacterized protein YdeI (BOF family)